VKNPKTSKFHDQNSDVHFIHLHRIFPLLIALMINSYISFADEVRFVGVTEPAHDIQLSFPLDGVVQEIFVKEGDAVKKGAPLLRLDDQLQALETKRREMIWRDRSHLDAEQDKLKIVAELLQSNRELYQKTGSISADEVKRLEIQHVNTAGEVNALAEAKKKERIEYEIARSVLDRHVLRSPIEGTVTDLFIEQGEWIRTGKEIVRIVDTSMCYLEVNMDEKYARQLKAGSRLDVHLEGKTMEKGGEVIFISPVADRGSSLVRIKVRFTNNSDLTPGVTASIHLNVADGGITAVSETIQ